MTAQKIAKKKTPQSVLSGSMTTRPGNCVSHVVEHSTVQYFVIETLCLQSRCDRGLNSRFRATLFGCLCDTFCHTKSMAHGCGDLTSKFGHDWYQEFLPADPLAPFRFFFGRNNIENEYTKRSITVLSNSSCTHFYISQCFSTFEFASSRTFLCADCLVAENEIKGKLFPTSVHMNVFYVFVFPGTTSVCQGWAACAPVVVILMTENPVLKIPLQNRIVDHCCPPLPCHANSPHRISKNPAFDSFRHARTGGGTWREKVKSESKNVHSCLMFQHFGNLNPTVVPDF